MPKFWRADRGAPARQRLTTNRLHQSRFGETHHVIAGDDEVIDQSDLKQRERVLQPAGYRLISWRDLGYSTRVAMRENHSGRMARKSLSYHLPGMHRGAVNGTAKELDEFDQPIASIEEECREDLMLEPSELKREELPRAIR